MDKRTTHDTKVVVECQQEGAIKKLYDHVENTDKRIEIMQTGFGRMVEELCEKIDKLTDKFNEAMFSSPLHPNNGMINTVKRLNDEIAVLKSKLERYENADVLQDVTDVKKEIYKFKTQALTIMSVAGTILVLIELYFKIKG